MHCVVVRFRQLSAYFIAQTPTLACQFAEHARNGLSSCHRACYEFPRLKMSSQVEFTMPASPTLQISAMTNRVLREVFDALRWPVRPEAQRRLLPMTCHGGRRSTAKTSLGRMRISSRWRQTCAPSFAWLETSRPAQFRDDGWPYVDRVSKMATRKL